MDPCIKLTLTIFFKDTHTHIEREREIKHAFMAFTQIVCGYYGILYHCLTKQLWKPTFS
jgi:hypothetical protein